MRFCPPTARSLPAPRRSCHSRGRAATPLRGHGRLAPAPARARSAAGWRAHSVWSMSNWMRSIGGRTGRARRRPNFAKLWPWHAGGSLQHGRTIRPCPASGSMTTPSGRRSCPRCLPQTDGRRRSPRSTTCWRSPGRDRRRPCSIWRAGWAEVERLGPDERAHVLLHPGDREAFVRGGGPRLVQVGGRPVDASCWRLSASPTSPSMATSTDARTTRTHGAWWPLGGSRRDVRAGRVLGCSNRERGAWRLARVGAGRNRRPSRRALSQTDPVRRQVESVTSV